MCTSSDGQAIYITAHVFFEDLADLEEIIPPAEEADKLGLSIIEEKEESPILPKTYKDSILSIEASTPGNIKQCQTPKNRFFVKKAFCLLSKRMQSCKELNKINVYLRRAAAEGYLYSKFEEYVARLLFEVPVPSRNIPVKVRLYLPATQSL